MSPNFLTLPHPAHFPQFPLPPISNLENLNLVHQICAERYAVWMQNKCCIKVVICPGVLCTLSALSMTSKTSVTEILVVNFVCNKVLAFRLNSNMQDDIQFIGCEST